MFAFIISIAIMGCSSRAQEAPAEDIISVKVQPVKRVSLSTPVKLSGILAATDEIKLSFKTGGLIKRILVREGQPVKKGRLLAQLDLAEIKARLNQAVSGFEKAKRDLTRLEKLCADSVVTHEQFQNGKTAFDIAQSNLEITRFNFQHSSIHAPTNGRILKQLSEENELISPGTPLFIFGSSDGQWIIKVGVSDKDIIRFQLGDEAEVLFDVYRDKVFNGRVTELAAAANPMTGLFEIEVSINDQGIRLMSGFIGKVTLYPSQKKQVTLIPVASLIEGHNMNGLVYVPESENQTARKVNIKIDQILNDQLAVSEGLEDFEYVITDGAAYLQENSKIRITK